VISLCVAVVELVGKSSSASTAAAAAAARAMLLPSSAVTVSSVSVTITWVGDARLLVARRDGSGEAYGVSPTRLKGLRLTP